MCTRTARIAVLLAIAMPALLSGAVTTDIYVGDGMFSSTEYGKDYTVTTVFDRKGIFSENVFPPR